MRAEKLVYLIAVVAALHVAVLSFILGLRQVGYTLAATLSATVIWGAVFLLGERRRRGLCIAGAVAGLAVQQVAYQVWREELPGFWWPLAQFGALYFLVAYVIGRFAP